MDVSAITKNVIFSTHPNSAVKMVLQPFTENRENEKLASAPPPVFEKQITYAGKRLSFSINKELDQVIVRIIDMKTDKVIKEIPPAELQRVYERIRENLGLFLDQLA